jgi:hypothetical protein
VLRNFKLSVLNTVQSPRYYTVFAGFDVNGDGFPFSDRVGNIRRNTYRGDSSRTTDVRLQRVFNVSDRLKAQASAEVFNLFNRQNVNGIDTVYGAPDFSSAKVRRRHYQSRQSDVWFAEFRGPLEASTALLTLEFLTTKTDCGHSLIGAAPGWLGARRWPVLTPSC